VAALGFRSRGQSTGKDRSVAFGHRSIVGVAAAREIDREIGDFYNCREGTRKAEMDACTIHHLFGIEGDRLLLVFHTNRRGYEFRVVIPTGDVFGETSLFYTVNAALDAGRSWIGKP
jgi:hypothetical protein